MIKNPRKEHWNYFTDKIKLSKLHGYSHPDELVIDLYGKGYDCSDIAPYLDVNKYCILSHAKRLKLPIKSRGGRNYISLLSDSVAEIQSLPEMNRQIASEYACAFLCNIRTVWDTWNKVNFNGGANFRPNQ